MSPIEMSNSEEKQNNMVDYLEEDMFMKMLYESNAHQLQEKMNSHDEYDIFSCNSQGAMGSFFETPRGDPAYMQAIARCQQSNMMCMLTCLHWDKLTQSKEIYEFIRDQLMTMKFKNHPHVCKINKVFIVS